MAAATEESWGMVSRRRERKRGRGESRARTAPLLGPSCRSKKKPLIMLMVMF